MGAAIEVQGFYRFGNSVVRVTHYAPSTTLRDGTRVSEGRVDVTYANGDSDRVEEETFRFCAKATTGWDA